MTACTINSCLIIHHCIYVLYIYTCMFNGPYSSSMSLSNSINTIVFGFSFVTEMRSVLLELTTFRYKNDHFDMITFPPS